MATEQTLAERLATPKTTVGDQGSITERSTQEIIDGETYQDGQKATRTNVRAIFGKTYPGSARS